MANRYYTNELSQYYLSEMARKTHGKRKMRVGFLVVSIYSWHVLRRIYEEFCQRDDAEAFLVLTPLYEANGSDGKQVEYYERSRWKYFHEKYPGQVFDLPGVMDLSKFKFDYLFFQLPYDMRRPPAYSIDSNDLVKYTKVCYISYAYNGNLVGQDDFLRNAHSFFRNTYFFFTSAAHQRDVYRRFYSQNCDLGYQHVEFLGNPTFEDDFDQEPPLLPVKRVMWAPCWDSMPDDRTKIQERFVEYKDPFIAMCDEYKNSGKEIEFAVRPHPAMIKELLQEKAIKQEDWDDFSKKIKERNILWDDNGRELRKALHETDVMIGEHSNIQVMFTLMGRPVIYCKYRAHSIKEQPSFEELMEGMYVAENWEDVRRYMDDLVAGNDPKKERRMEIAAKWKKEHVGAAHRIVERLVEDFQAQAQA